MWSLWLLPGSFYITCVFHAAEYELQILCGESMIQEMSQKFAIFQNPQKVNIICICWFDVSVPRRDGLAVGQGFVSLPGHTKDFPCLACMYVSRKEFDSATLLSKRMGSV